MAAVVMPFRSFFVMVVVGISIGLLATGGIAENHLLSGDIIKAGENISDIYYNLRMQQDCNLVLYENVSNRIIWNIFTNGKGIGCELTLLNDGNLVIYDEKKSIVWETKTNGTIGNYVLLLQRNRNLVIYKDPLWSSGSKL